MSWTLLSHDQRANEPAVHQLHQRLRVEYAGQRTAAEVDAAMEYACHRYEGIRVRQFVLVLLERAMRERLGRPSGT